MKRRKKNKQRSAKKYCPPELKRRKAEKEMSPLFFISCAPGVHSSKHKFFLTFNENWRKSLCGNHLSRSWDGRDRWRTRVEKRKKAVPLLFSRHFSFNNVYCDRLDCAMGFSFAGQIHERPRKHCCESLLCISFDLRKKEFVVGLNGDLPLWKICGWMAFTVFCLFFFFFFRGRLGFFICNTGWDKYTDSIT